MPTRRQLIVALALLTACTPQSAPAPSGGVAAPTTTILQSATTSTSPAGRHATPSPSPSSSLTEARNPPNPPSRWESTNPGGGGAFSAVAAVGDLLVVATDLSGVVVSRDRGESWRTAGAFSGIIDTHAAAVWIDPDEPSTVYVGTDGGLYRSTDAGDTFTALAPRGFVSAVTARGRYVYAGIQSEYDRADASLLRSTDGGDTWEEVPLPPGRYVVKLHLDPSDPTRVLILTGDGRFVSGPAELHLLADDDLQRLDLDGVVDAVFDPHRPATVWATTGNGEDPGRLWMANEGPFRPVVDHGGVIWAPADQPGTIRLIDPRRQFPWDDEQGTWESVDGGGTWQRIGEVTAWNPGWSQVLWGFTDGFGGPVPSLGFDPRDGDRAALVNSQFAYASDDGGKTFVPIFTDEVKPGWFRSRGLDNVVVADVAIGADGAIYAGYWDLGCFRSLDGGGSWANCNTAEYSGDWEGYGGFTGTVVADPERPGVVWAAHGADWESEATLLRSNDGAATWTPTSGIPPGPDLLGLSIDPTSPRERRTLAVTSGGDVYVSSDDGQTWTLDFACGGCRTTTIGPDGTIFAGGEAGLWRRGPDGWVEAGSDLGGDVAGPPWSYEWRGVSGLAVGSDGTLWVAVLGDGGGIFRDDGDGLTPVLAGRYYRDVAVDPTDSNIVYAASSSAMEQGGYDPESRGLEVSTNGGVTWSVRNDGLAWPFVSTVAVGSGMVVLGSPGTGVAVGR